MTTIKLKNGSGAPLATDLVQGEVALDLTNKRIYSENASGVVVEMGTSPSTIDINAGTIDGTVIGGASAAAGTFTTANATTVDTTNIEVTNVKAKDGTASATIADSTGVMTIASSVLTTTDINGGSIDGVTIGGASAGAGTFTTVTATNGVIPTVFGGTGASQTFTLQSTSGNANNSKILIGNVVSSDNGGISLFSAGASTSTLRMRVSGTTGDISFYEDTGTTPKLFWDASAESLGIGTTSPASKLGINGSITLGLAPGPGGSYGSLDFRYANSASTGRAGYIDVVQVSAGNSGHMIFATNNNTPDSADATERMRIDSSGNVGIGTTSPRGKVEIVGPASETSTLANAVTNAGLLIKPYSSSDWGLAFGSLTGQVQSIQGVDLGGASSRSIAINALGGNVGIGTDSPGVSLEIKSGDPYIRLTDSVAPTGYSQVMGTHQGALVLSADTSNSVASSHLRFDVDATERMRIDSSGNLLVGTTSASTRFTLNVSGANDGITLRTTNEGAIGLVGMVNPGSNNDIQIGTLGANNLLFFTNGTANKRMRIDTNGNVGIGTTSNSFNSAGLPFVVGSGSGNTGMTIYSGNASAGSIHFADAVSTGTDSFRGFLNYNHSTNSMQLGTDGTERMRIDSSGNVGIGTTSPGSKLHVAGQIEASTDTTTPSGGSAYFYKSSVGATVSGFNAVVETGSAGSRTERLRITSAGNVGIGTSSPNGSLTIRNSGNAELILGSSLNTGGRDWRLGRDNAVTGDFTIKSSDTTNTNTTTEHMRIKGNGNVGIKTTPEENTTLSLGTSVSLTVAASATATVATQSGGKKQYLVGVSQADDSRKQSFGIWFAPTSSGGQYLELGNNNSAQAKDHTLAVNGATLEITETSGSEKTFLVTMLCFGS